MSPLIEGITWSVGIAAVLGSGIGGVLKMKFMTKKDFERRENLCQRKIIDMLHEVKDSQAELKQTQERRYDERIGQMSEIREFMGKVNYHITQINGRI